MLTAPARALVTDFESTLGLAERYGFFSCKVGAQANAQTKIITTKDWPSSLLKWLAYIDIRIYESANTIKLSARAKPVIRSFAKRCFQNDD
jgi:hypothetical protein